MIDREIMEAFVTESRDHLATVETEILGLEQGEADPERVNRLYRALHTVKGAASFLGLRKPTRLAHALEDVLGQIRAGSLAPTESVTEALLRGVDKLKRFVDAPEDDSPTIESEVGSLEAVLVGAAPEERPSTAAAAPRSSAVAAAPQPVAVAPRPSAAASESQTPPGPVSAAVVETTVAREIAHATTEVAEPPGEPSGSLPAVAGDSTPAAGAQSVRISLAVLDRLMNLGSELVLVRNQALQAIDSGELEALAAIGQRLSVVTSELQGTIMQTRMRPVGDVFSRFRRVVRDLARTQDKQVDLTVDGADVELDKSIIEAIKDPLTHLIRNAVDHGIEPPTERTGKGKPLRGHIVLGAFHHGGQVHIRVADDGRGMDPSALKEHAVTRGTITREQAGKMTDRDAYNLIFSPGFSMAKQVTDLSGRGVGMDVVKSSFSRLGGVIEVTSAPDNGTAITVRLPLTLAIVPSLIVAVEEVCFAVPQLNIDEVVWLYGDQVHQALKMVDDQEVYWLRGKLLPVLRLSKLLDIPKTFTEEQSGRRHHDRREQRPDRRGDDQLVDDDARQGEAERRRSLQNSVYILVLELGSDAFGLLVDRVIDTEEIVVKPLHDQLKQCRAFAGTTVLGDGRIAMILDVAAVVDLAGLGFRRVETVISRVKSSSEAPRTALLFDTGGSEWFAAPLSAITRVEEITARDIQMANGREYLRYRGAMVPLLRLERVIEGLSVGYPDQPLYVIIPKCRRPFGVLAAHILDTIEIAATIDTETIVTPGLFGTTMVADRMTLLVDFFGILDAIEPAWLRPLSSQDQPARRVLLVEDSEFIAAQITNYLKSVGQTVTRVTNGEQALAYLETAELPDLIVSDIEMPLMDGLEMCQRLRADARTRSLPIYAVSAMVDDTLEARALEAGFDAFESKNDQGRLFERLMVWCQGEPE